MCVIALFKKSRPDLATLQKMHNENSDGAGIAWFHKGFAHYIKGITKPEEVFELTQKLKLPFAIHFRLASCGGKNLLLTHPFSVNKKSTLKLQGKCKRLLFHNGTHKEVTDYLAAAKIYPDKDELMSDSRAIAMIISNNNERFLTTFEGYKHKFIFMDANTNIFWRYGIFFEENGNFFSNLRWQYSSNHSYTHGYDQKYWNEFLKSDFTTYNEFMRYKKNVEEKESQSSNYSGSDQSKLPSHYQRKDKPEDECINPPAVIIKESLSELISDKKSRRKYKRWLWENRGILNPLPKMNINIVEIDNEPSSKQPFTESEFFGNDQKIIDAETIARQAETDMSESFREHEQPPEDPFIKRCGATSRAILGLSLPTGLREAAIKLLNRGKVTNDIDI